MARSGKCASEVEGPLVLNVPPPAESRLSFRTFHFPDFQISTPLGPLSWKRYVT
jgi:hypothetical protein